MKTNPLEEAVDFDFLCKLVLWQGDQVDLYRTALEMIARYEVDGTEKLDDCIRAARAALADGEAL
tara:strand:+ start:161 stop:355 length:195 start_codon:yes stop_codon:yes gene_type:complete